MKGLLQRPSAMSERDRDFQNTFVVIELQGTEITFQVGDCHPDVVGS